MPQQERSSTSPEEEDKYKDIMGFLYSIEEKLDKELGHISNKLKEMLDRLIEKKLEYYL